MGATFLARIPGPARIGLPLAITALVAAACGSSGGGSGPGGGSAKGAAVTIKTAKGSSADFLTDGSGRAVYLWVADPKDKSTCAANCLTYWPPVTTSGTPVAAGGVTSTDLGTITRKDGSKQVTYAGHPLYRFKGDSGPGQTSGQGLDDFGAHWWLVAPSGKQITGKDSAAGSAPASSGSTGYGY